MMTEKTKKTARGRLNPAKTTKPPTNPKNPWQRGASINLNQSVRDGLYSVYYHLDKATRQDLGLMMKVPVFIKDPLVAMENPTLGVQEISVRLEKNMGSGPTSSRVAVVDYNANNQELTTPVIWDDAVGWFQTPLPQSEWLPGVPDVPEDMSKVEDPDKYSEQYRQFIEKTVKNPYFHQVNVWAVVQRVLESLRKNPPHWVARCLGASMAIVLSSFPMQGMERMPFMTSTANRCNSIILAINPARDIPAFLTISSPMKPGTPSLMVSGRSIVRSLLLCRQVLFTSSLGI